MFIKLRELKFKLLAISARGVDIFLDLLSNNKVAFHISSSVTAKDVDPAHVALNLLFDFTLILAQAISDATTWNIHAVDIATKDFVIHIECDSKDSSKYAAIAKLFTEKVEEIGGESKLPGTVEGPGYQAHLDGLPKTSLHHKLATQSGHDVTGSRMDEALSKSLIYEEDLPEIPKSRSNKNRDKQLEEEKSKIVDAIELETSGTAPSEPDQVEDDVPVVENEVIEENVLTDSEITEEEA